MNVVVSRARTREIASLREILRSLRRFKCKEFERKKKHSRCRPCHKGPYLGKKCVIFTKE